MLELFFHQPSHLFSVESVKHVKSYSSSSFCFVHAEVAEFLNKTSKVFSTNLISTWTTRLLKNSLKCEYCFSDISLVLAAFV